MSTGNNNATMILNYHDAVLYESDLAILQSPCQWLNDACIHFFLTRLSQRFSSQDIASSVQRKQHVFQFIDPSVLSFFMHQWDADEDGDEDVLGIMKRPEQRASTATFFLPINDNYVSHSWMTPGGGTHWSLLLMTMSYDTIASESKLETAAEWMPPTPASTHFWHFDSSVGSNQRAAKAVAGKIQKVISGWRSNSNDEKLSQGAMFPPLHECSAPQQSNGFDCGLHTLATAEALATGLASIDYTIDTNPSKEQLEQMVKEAVATTPSFCQRLRTRIVKDVELLATAG